MKTIQWGKYKVGDLFEIKPTKAYKLTNDELFIPGGRYPVVTNSSFNNGITGYTDLEPTEVGNMITYSDTTTSESIFYQPNDFVGYSHIQGLYPIKYKNQWNRNTLLYIVTCIRKSAAGKFSYGSKFNRKLAAELIIELPISNGEIDFEFMDTFVAELEAQHVAELEAYLFVTGLDNYELTKEEQIALDNYDSLLWGTFNLKVLFGSATRGKRLKSVDRIVGDLPFVTAGERNEGISAFIGNNVEIFSKNTTTIDMFGSAKYRNYTYGADDHIAVVHTEALDKFEAIFVSAAIHKASYTGEFSYSKNFYAKDADNLNITLPIIKEDIDFVYMRKLISAVQKLVIKEVVLYSQKRIQSIESVIN